MSAVTRLIGGPAVTLAAMGESEAWRQFGAELDEIRELAQQELRAEQELEDIKADLLRAMIAFRRRHPTRGVVTRMADVITEVRGDNVERRTQISRAIGTASRAARRPRSASG